MGTLRTDDLSLALRDRCVRPSERKLLISKFEGSSQETDLSVPPNCGGYGRIHHFRYQTPEGWPVNPLPMAPAARRLNLPIDDVCDVQVFQNAACNWRCWYCFVPFSMLSANLNKSDWMTAEDLVQRYISEADRPLVIDCSGGQPDLVPEWIPWMMAALKSAGIADQVYLWSDDNLSNDYFWRYLDRGQRRLISSYKNYGRVCCFKGYDAASFSFNTKADPGLFERQFELFSKLLNETRMDLYAYATFTGESVENVEYSIASFVDRLIAIHPNLPLRLVPLRVQLFGVVHDRVGDTKNAALSVQELAICAWNREIDSRFTPEQRRQLIVDIDLRS